jgi:hypothetical protein
MANALARVAGFLLVAAFPDPKQEEPTVNFTVQCQLTVFGYSSPNATSLPRSASFSSPWCSWVCF